MTPATSSTTNLLRWEDCRGIVSVRRDRLTSISTDTLLDFNSRPGLAGDTIADLWPITYPTLSSPPDVRPVNLYLILTLVPFSPHLMSCWLWSRYLSHLHVLLTLGPLCHTYVSSWSWTRYLSHLPCPADLGHVNYHTFISRCPWFRYLPLLHVLLTLITGPLARYMSYLISCRLWARYLSLLHLLLALGPLSVIAACPVALGSITTTGIHFTYIHNVHLVILYLNTVVSTNDEKSRFVWAANNLFSGLLILANMAIVGKQRWKACVYFIALGASQTSPAFCQI